MTIHDMYAEEVVECMDEVSEMQKRGSFDDLLKLNIVGYNVLYLEESWKSDSEVRSMIVGSWLKRRPDCVVRYIIALSYNIINASKKIAGGDIVGEKEFYEWAALRFPIWRYMVISQMSFWERDIFPSTQMLSLILYHIMSYWLKEDWRKLKRVAMILNFSVRMVVQGEIRRALEHVGTRKSDYIKKIGSLEEVKDNPLGYAYYDDNGNLLEVSSPLFSYEEMRVLGYAPITSLVSFQGSLWCREEDKGGLGQIIFAIDLVALLGF